MAQGTRMYDVVLMTLFLYSVFIYTESSDTTTPPCSWGSWLPWDCSCCGASIDNTVYRVRPKCCEETVCTQLRVDAVTVTPIGTNNQRGTCDKNCNSQFGSHHGKMCFPEMPKLEDIAWPNKRNSCSAVCLDIVATPTSAATTTNGTSPQQPNISITTTTTTTTTDNEHKTISWAQAPTTDSDISPSTEQPVTKGTPGISDHSKVTTGHDSNSLARVTANCHLVLGIALAAIVVLILF